MPIRIFITEGTRADRKEVIFLIEGIDAEYHLADRGYDTNEVIDYATMHKINVVILPKRIVMNNVLMTSLFTR